MAKRDLKNMTRAEKLALLDAIEEKKRRLLTARPPYKPHAGQLRVHTSKALERYLFCGNGFGKSCVLVNEVHWAATGFNEITNESHPVPAKIVLLLDTPEKIEDFITEYRKWHDLPEDYLHKRGKAHYSFFQYPNGSTVTVMTHEVTDLKLEGSQWTHIFADEPPPRKVFLALFRGGRIKGRPLRTLLCGTPITAAWLRTDVYEPWVKGEMPQAECFKGNSRENSGNLEDGYLDRFASKLTEAEREIRMNGAFHDLEGLALAHLFRRDTHLVDRGALEWHEQNPCVLIMDPHTAKPHHAVVLGVDRDGYLFVLEEYKSKVIARKFIREIISLGWLDRYNMMDILYDSAGNAESTSGEGFKSFGAVINEELKAAGYGRARGTTYSEKDDEEWVERIQDSLAIPDEPNNFGQRIPKLRVVADLKGTIADIENVQWLRDKRNDVNKPKLDISHKDFLSCVKYGLATKLYPNKKKDKVYYRRKPAYGFEAKPTNPWAKFKRPRA